MVAPRTKTQLKQDAQAALMQGIAKTLGYYKPEDYGEEYTPEELEELHRQMKIQADRVAKILGFTQAWTA